MELQHVNVKIYVDGDLSVDPEQFIEIFHRWIADQIADELLIDVADYRHVPDGPGVVLVGHEADYALDHARGRYGMLYNRKDVVPGSNDDRLEQAFRAVTQACLWLEAELDSGLLKFSRQEFEIVINDRALAPNTEATFANIRRELEAYLSRALGHDEFGIERHSEDPRNRFGVVVSISKPYDFASLAIH